MPQRYIGGTTNNAALGNLVGHLTRLLESEAFITPKLQQVAVAHLRELLAATLGVPPDPADEVPTTGNRRGLGAARLSAIKADILVHLGARDLSLDAVAKRQGISPIYVRKLLESEDTSFTRFVLGERLARAHRLLSDPHLADCTIAALALEAGFGDLSYFNRAFRRRYGAAPSDVRATAAGGG
jgi:AraC-like DNA-binding protein